MRHQEGRSIAMGNEEGSKTVLAGPEFGIVHIMRPYRGFEAVYQGQLSTRPIYLCEANKPYDPLAIKRTPGIDPHLVAGLPCVFGSRVVIWLLNLQVNEYTLRLVWRFRNLFDHRNSADRVPYHIAKQGPGVPELVVDPGPRVVIPAAFDTAIYQQTEPANPPAQCHAMINDVEVVSPRVTLDPLMPDGVRGAVCQGVGDPSGLGGDLTPRWVQYEVQAAGDELLMSYQRPVTFGQWQFLAGQPDKLFADMLGNGTGVEYPDVGVYVSFGVSP
jgi:hypothetical protein